MKTFQKISTWSSKQKLIGVVAIGCVSIICLCCLCSILIALLNLPTLMPEVSKVTVANGESTPISAETEKTGEVTTIVPADTPIPTYTPTMPPAGDPRDNLIPAGTPADVSGDMTITIVGVTRPADSIVSDANMFNVVPETNQEYMQVDIQVICNKPSNDKCYFAAFEIKAVGADGNIIEKEAVIAGVDGLMESGELIGGGTRTGKIFFIVPKDDTSVVVFYDSLLFGDLIYFALP